MEDCISHRIFVRSDLFQLHHSEQDLVEPFWISSQREVQPMLLMLLNELDLSNCLYTLSVKVSMGEVVRFASKIV